MNEIDKEVSQEREESLVELLHKKYRLDMEEEKQIMILVQILVVKLY